MYVPSVPRPPAGEHLTVGPCVWIEGPEFDPTRQDWFYMDVSSNHRCSLTMRMRTVPAHIRGMYDQHLLKHLGV